MMLDALFKIKDEQDPTLAFRRSCRCASQDLPACLRYCLAFLLCAPIFLRMTSLLFCVRALLAISMSLYFPGVNTEISCGVVGRS